MSILYFFIFFTLVVFFHELGHLWIAKRAGIGVREFAIGLGPKLIRFRRNGTEYQLRLFPLGGLVKIAGMDDDGPCDPSEDYYTKPWVSRFALILAGPLFNFLVALGLFWLIFSGLGLQDKPSNRIEGTKPGLPAAMAGLKKGDLIVRFNETEITADNATWMVQTIRKSHGARFVMEVERGSQHLLFKITPQVLVTENISLAGFILETGARHRYGLWQGFTLSLQQIERSMEGVTAGLALLGTGRVGIDSLMGPVGIVRLTGSAAQAGWVDFLFLMAFLSVNLGLLNLLPIPALDGGRLLFLLIERIIGRPVDPKKENWVHMMGFVLLIALMVYVTVHNDLGLLKP
jgi:regulator of sigma E protease